MKKHKPKKEDDYEVTKKLLENKDILSDKPIKDINGDDGHLSDTEEPIGGFLFGMLAILLFVFSAAGLVIWILFH